MIKKESAFQITCYLKDFLGDGVTAANGQEENVERVKNFPISLQDFSMIKPFVKYLGVTKNFADIIESFQVPAGETPAGFRAEFELVEGGCLQVDLKRDIGYGKNSVKRGTGMIFSADCADPYKIKAFGNLIGNITTNPSIIYDRFINNEKANIGHRFTTREQVLRAMSTIVGPGVDVSVELNNPFESDSEILEEAARFREIINPYQLVVKVPHLGPLTKENVGDLLDGRFPLRYDEASVESACRSHDMAMLLYENGYRVNFTLMAESHQTALALQVKPAYINTFMRNRYHYSEKIDAFLKCFEATGDEKHLEELRKFLIASDYLSCRDTDLSLFEVKRKAEWLMKYQGWQTSEGSDGLDQSRHALRELRNSNLPDTRLIICSLDSSMYSMVDRMLMEKEYADMADRVVITADPDYLAGFASSPAVLKYNKSFIAAAASEKSGS